MKRLYVMVILTSLFFIAELVVGLMTNTLSLVADSFHMLSDSMSMVVGIVALRVCVYKIVDMIDSIYLLKDI